MPEETVTYFGQWCEVTSCGGVIDWYRARNLVGKIFWWIFITFSLGLTVWQTVAVFVDYFQGAPYRTSVSIEPKTGLQFPQVTVCNFNRALRSSSKRYGVNSSVLSYVYGTLPINYDLPLNKFIEVNMTEYEQELKELINRHPEFSDTNNLLKTLGHRCESTMITCSWAGSSFDCCKRITEVVTAYGNCFTIHPPDEDDMQHIPGASQGLKLIMNSQLDEYPTDLVMNNFLEEGFVVGIGYVFEPQLPDPIVIAPGQHSWIALTAHMETSVRPQVQVYTPPCRSDTNLEILNASYSKPNCFFDCRLLSAWKICGCLPHSHTQKPYPFCNGTYMADCINKITDAHNSLANCTQNCKTPCVDTWAISATVSSTSYPAPALSTAISQMLTAMNFSTTEAMLKYMSSIDVYFPNLEAIKIEMSETTSVFTFISNIGGQLGLWLGISLITVVQTLYYIVDWLVMKATERNETKTKKLPKNKETSFYM